MVPAARIKRVRAACQISGEHGVQLIMNPISERLKVPLYSFFHEGVNTPIIMCIVLYTSNLAACRQGWRKKVTMYENVFPVAHLIAQICAWNCSITPPFNLWICGFRVSSCSKMRLVTQRRKILLLLITQRLWNQAKETLWGDESA